ncbi:MAG: 4'-phosphopantetheinyl transferase superfamily protein [Fibrobacter sp.]|nr:4'-phosphopantetheinyl transferase superfamily protein [Fibrobacter sp.]
MIKPTMLFSTKIPDFVSENTLSMLRMAVSPGRRERSTKFKFQQDALRSLTGELLLRYGLIKYGFEKIDSIQFGVNEFGKPFLTDVSDFDISISHSGKWVVAGFSSCAIGVDVEMIKKIDFAIAEQFFTAQDCSLIKSTNDKVSAREMFYRIWVLKESYVKAIGKGLSCPLNSFYVNKIDGDLVTFSYVDENLQEMFAKEYYIGDEYKMAVSCQKKMFPSKLSFVEFEEVIDTVVK